MLSLFVCKKSNNKSNLASFLCYDFPCFAPQFLHTMQIFSQKFKIKDEYEI